MGISDGRRCGRLLSGSTTDMEIKSIGVEQKQPIGAAGWEDRPFKWDVFRVATGCTLGNEHISEDGLKNLRINGNIS